MCFEYEFGSKETFNKNKLHLPDLAIKYNFEYSLFNRGALPNNVKLNNGKRIYPSKSTNSFCNITIPTFKKQYSKISVDEFLECF